jgi:hypothetical protein
VFAEEGEQLLPDRNTCSCSKLMTQNKNRGHYDLTKLHILKYQLVKLTEDDPLGSHNLKGRLKIALKAVSHIKVFKSYLN